MYQYEPIEEIKIEKNKDNISLMVGFNRRFSPLVEVIETIRRN